MTKLLKALFLVIFAITSDCSSTLSLRDRVFTAVSEKLKPSHQSQLLRDISLLELDYTKQKYYPSPDEFWNLLKGDWTLLYTNNAGRVSILSDRTLIPGLVKLDTVEQNFIGDFESDGKKVFHVLRFKGLAPATVTLKHTAAITSTSNPAQIAIDLDTVSADPKNLPAAFELKGLGPSFLRRGYFDVSIFVLLAHEHDQVFLKFKIAEN